MIPSLSGSSKAILNTLEFYGLNETPYIDDRELADMQNMGNSYMPYLAPRPPRQLVDTKMGIQYMMPQQEETYSFTGVANNVFYYKGTAITQNVTEFTAALVQSPTIKSIVTFGDKLIVFPHFFCFDTKRPENGLVSLNRSSINVTRVAFTNDTDGNTIIYVVNINGGATPNLKTYFSPGDYLNISFPAGYEHNQPNLEKLLVPYENKAAEDDYVSNGICIITKVETQHLTVKLFDKNNIPKIFNNNYVNNYCQLTFSTPPINIDYATVLNNRIYGVNGNDIYVSKLGSHNRFYSCLGTSSDSWHGTVSTDSSFNGIAAYNGIPLLTKPYYIHEIQGNNAQTLGIPYCLNCGCADGRSICEINGLLYFLGTDGIYVYSGGMPQLISSKIKKKYLSGVGGTDGKHYYLSAFDGNSYDLLVYDIQTGFWYKEDHLQVLFFSRHGSALYAAAADGKIYLFNSDTAETFDWYAVTKTFEDSGNYLKTASTLTLRSEMPAGSIIKIWINYDSGSFELVKTITASHLKPVHIPLRLKPCYSYQLKISGSGNVKIHELERKLYLNGQHL